MMTTTPRDPYQLLRAQVVANLEHTMESSSAVRVANPRLVQAAIARAMATDGDPSTWTRCEHCDGSGSFYSVTTGKDGICFQCRGKSMQSPADRRRNAAHARHKSERGQIQ